MKKVSIQFLIVFVSLHFVGCTNYLYKRANVEFDNLQYFFAAKDYNKVLTKESSHHGAKIKLANCYRLMNDYKKADSLYAEIVTYPEVDSIEFFNYAKVLLTQGDYDGAKEWVKRYLENQPKDKDALMLLASCESKDEFMRDTTLYTLNGFGLTEFTSSFSCVPYMNGVVFTAEKEEAKGRKKNPWTGNSYLDLYYVEYDSTAKDWTNPILLGGGLNGKYHEGPATFNHAGDVVYFTRSNYNHNQLDANDDDVNTLKLFTAKLIDGEWKELEPLPFNGEEYSVGHPHISKDDKTLYFISNQPGGFGGTDIYKAVYNDSTGWSTAENLGPEINTSGNEMYPMMGDDGIFYFSSTSHTNMGGLDVFQSTYSEQTKKWSMAENLAYPLNSNKDDFGLVLSKDGSKTGYVSSNRGGADKIYAFEKHDPTFYVMGVAKYKGYEIPVPGALVEVVNEETNTKLSAVTDAKGEYKIKLEYNAKYSMLCTKEGCFKLSDNVSTKNKKYSEDFVVNFVLDSIIVEKPIVVENIYYDYDKWKLRDDAKVELDKLVLLLNDNQNLSIEMSSHCDSRGSDDYNLKLSDKRAKSTVKYLTSKGINKKRLSWKGYGETMLVNKCANDIECTEEEHQQNRRTEFKVTKIEEELAPKATISEVR